MKTNKFWDFKMPKKVLNNFNLKQFGGRRDWDFDGVINSKDCQPRNTMRQDKISDFGKRIGSELQINRKIYREQKSSNKLRFFPKEGPKFYYSENNLFFSNLSPFKLTDRTKSSPNPEEEKEQIFKYIKSEAEKTFSNKLINIKYKEGNINQRTSDSISIKVEKENLGPAPIQKQQEWQNKTEVEKNTDRIIKSDTDGDNVPDEYDCQPEDSTRQDLYSVPKVGNPIRHKNDLAINMVGHPSRTDYFMEARFRTEAPYWEKDRNRKAIAISGVSDYTEYTEKILAKKPVFNQFVKAIQLAQKEENLPGDTKIYTWVDFTHKGYPSGSIESLKPAPKQKQQEWYFKSNEEKTTDRITKEDTDIDGVPNEYDCQPEDSTRQDWDVERARKIGQYVVGMSPREYLRRTFVTPSMMLEAKKDKAHWLSMFSDVKTQKREPLTKLQEYIKSPTEKVPVPFVYYNYGQEGRHRALAAEQLGIKTIPVAVQRPFAHTQPDVAEAFVQKAFPKAHITYKREWEERFKKGSPEHYMDLETFNKYKEVLEERGYKDVTGTYEETNFDKLKRHEEVLEKIKKLNLQPANIEKQQEWHYKSETEKDTERMIKPDVDEDNVPDEYDCQPFNTMRQDIRWGRRPRRKTEEEWNKDKRLVENLTYNKPTKAQLEGQPTGFTQISKINLIENYDRELKKLKRVHPVHRDELWHEQYNTELKNALQLQGYNEETANEYLEQKNRKLGNLANYVVKKLEGEGLFLERKDKTYPQEEQTIIPTSDLLPACTLCKGTGYLNEPSGKVVCPDCLGTGMENGR